MIPDAYQLVGGTGWVAQRAEQVKYGRPAELSAGCRQGRGEGMEAIASYFKFAERGTSFGTEVKAGIATFMLSCCTW